MKGAHEDYKESLGILGDGTTTNRSTPRRLGERISVDGNISVWTPDDWRQYTIPFGNASEISAARSYSQPKRSAMRADVSFGFTSLPKAIAS